MDQGKIAFAAHKAFAVGESLINTYQGISKAWAQGGIFGAVGAVAVGAAGLAQVNKILTTSPSSSAGGLSTNSVNVGDNTIQQPPQQQSQQQTQPPKQIIFNVTGYTNNEIIRTEFLPVIKEYISEDDEILFDNDSRQAQLLRAG